MPAKTLFQSFAGGEITPEMYGRLDLVKFQTGLSRALNCITLPHGPAARRPGFEFVNECKVSATPVRLMPFQFSADQGVVLEFGHLYVRFHVDGATVVEAGLDITGITKANPGVLTYTGTDPANGDWMYLSGIGGMTELNGRWAKVASVNAGANTFELTDLWDANINTTAHTTYTSGGTAARAYTIVSPYDSADVFDLVFAQSADVVTITHPSYPAKELARSGATSWAFSTVDFASSIDAPLIPTVTPTTATAGKNSPQSYRITAIAADGITESLPSPRQNTNNDLSIAGNYNTITWLAVTGASRYFVYKQRGGGYGYIGSTDTLSAIDDNILPDTSQTPPEEIITLNTGTDDYPSAVAYHEQRRWFGGTNDKPQALFATRTGTDSNLTSSIPSRDADGMDLKLSSGQYNLIRHIVPLSDLLVFTAGGEFRVSADGAPSITPTSVSVKPQSFAGSSGVQPVVTTGSILYVQSLGTRIGEMAYTWEQDAYRSIDVSIMIPHRLDGYTVTQLAYARAPFGLLWAMRSDGTLLGMTHVPDQQVYGWHAHTTGGTIESVCTVAENNRDALYAAIKRTIYGREVRYIERMKPLNFGDLENAFFVDCGLTYSGAAATTISGLWHLEGETVSILGDGAVEPDQEVINGAVTLETAASVVHIGKSYNTDIRTLPLANANAAAGGQGSTKNISKLYIRVNDTSVVQAGPTFSRLREYPARSVEDPYDSPPSLISTVLEISIEPNWVMGAPISIRQSLPLPLTVVSIAAEFQSGG